METAPRRRGRPPRNRPEAAKPDILANAMPPQDIDALPPERQREIAPSRPTTLGTAGIASMQMQNPYLGSLGQAAQAASLGQAHHAPPLSDYAQHLADDTAEALGEPIRAPMRPEMRAEAPRQLSSRELAEQRANEILGHLNGDLDDGIDRFAIPAHEIPDGWSYEWVRNETLGKQDPHYWASKIRNGWNPVPASRHPHMMPQNHTGAITLDGLILCERPAVITDRAKQLEYRKAREQVQIKEQQLNEAPAGTLPREAPNLKPKVSHSWEAGMPIPD